MQFKNEGLNMEQTEINRPFLGEISDRLCVLLSSLLYRCTLITPVNLKRRSLITWRRKTRLTMDSSLSGQRTS